METTITIGSRKIGIGVEGLSKYRYPKMNAEDTAPKLSRFGVKSTASKISKEGHGSKEKRTKAGFL